MSPGAFRWNSVTDVSDDLDATRVMRTREIFDSN